MDLLLSARVVLAEEALQLGLVDRLCEPEQLVDEAVAYARDLARNCSPRSMAVIKQQVLGDWERGAEESRRLSLRLLAELREGPDFVEGVRSYTEKRTANFQGLSIDIDVELE
jgi:enoyl-CoA hydratase/carnithine racemase